MCSLPGNDDGHLRVHMCIRAFPAQTVRVYYSVL